MAAGFHDVLCESRAPDSIPRYQQNSALRTTFLTLLLTAHTELVGRKLAVHKLRCRPSPCAGVTLLHMHMPFTCMRLAQSHL